MRMQATLNPQQFYSDYLCLGYEVTSGSNATLFLVNPTTSETQCFSYDQRHRDSYQLAGDLHDPDFLKTYGLPLPAIEALRQDNAIICPDTLPKDCPDAFTLFRIGKSFLEPIATVIAERKHQALING